MHFVLRLEVVRGEGFNDVELARLRSLSEAVEFTISVGDPIARLFVGTTPPVWLSAASLVGETDPAGAVVRFYRLARELLAAEGVPTVEVGAQLPLACADTAPGEA